MCKTASTRYVNRRDFPKEARGWYGKPDELEFKTPEERHQERLQRRRLKRQAKQQIQQRQTRRVDSTLYEPAGFSVLKK
jgi:hypothetical protein